MSNNTNICVNKCCPLDFPKTYGISVVKPNPINGVNMLTKWMLNKKNTKYVITLDFTLAEDIVVPQGCIIEFDGGSITNINDNGYSLTGQNTILSYIQRLDAVIKGVELKGTFVYKDGGLAADEEDITGEKGALQFANKEFNPDVFSGYGRVYLRKNIIDTEITDGWFYMPADDGNVYLLYRKNGLLYSIYDGTTGLVLVDNVVVETTNYDADKLPETAKDNKLGYVKCNTKIVVTLPNRCTITDHVINNSVIKKYDRNIASNGKNVLTQDMLPGKNTIYILQYDYDLNGQEVTVPENCILQFDGGSLRNGTIVGQNTVINAGLVKILNTDITLSGTWNIEDAFPEWFGAIRNSDNNSLAIEKAFSIPSSKVVLNGIYGIEKPIALTKQQNKLVGAQAFNTQRYGIYCSPNFSSIEYSDTTIDSIFYAIDNYAVPFEIEDVWLSGSYKASTSVFQFADHYVAIRMYRCYLFRFYNAGVILNKSDLNVISETKIQFCGVGIAGEGKKINYNNPLGTLGSALRRPNHTTISNCQFHKCNVGVVFVYCSDVTVENCLFGYNSLCSARFTECHTVNIHNNYIEGDANYKFLIKKDRETDPPDASQFSLGTEIGDEGLLSMDVNIRAYIYVQSESVCYVDEMFNSNYYVRSFKGSAGNAHTNANVSGIDCLIMLGAYASLNIGAIRNLNQMSIGGSRKYLAYDIGYVNANYSLATLDNTGRLYCSVVSQNNIRYRNFLTNVSEQTYALGLQRRIVKIEEPVSSLLAFGINVTNETVEGTIPDFYSVFKYNCTEKGIDYYLQSNNNKRNFNSLKVPFTTLSDDRTYRAEVHYKPNASISKRLQIVAKYSDNSTETVYDVTINSSSREPLIVYFSKNDFIKDGKTCDNVYIVNYMYGNQLISPVMLFIEGNETPVFIPMKRSGTVRPSIDSGVVFDFFDETLNKGIHWNGSKWLEDDGATAGVRRVGTFAQKPSSDDIYDGFEYINTDTKRNIYYRSNKWLDVDGANAEAKREGTMFERPFGTDIFVGFRFMDRTLGKPVFAYSIVGSNVKWIDSDGNMSQLPNGYTLVEAITGNVSNCRIDTGITESDDMEIECVFQDNEWGSYEPFFGCFTATSANATRLIYNANNDYTALININNKAQNMSPITYTAARKYSVVLNKSGIVIDGAFQSLYQDVAGTEQAQTIIINNTNLNTPLSVGTRTITWWYFVISKNGARVFSGVPCVRVSDGKVGLYDLVTNAFFGNAMSGDGEFEVYQE